MSGNPLPQFFHQNGIPPFLQSSTTPPPFCGQYQQIAPTPTPEQLQELANSFASRPAIPMKFTATEKEMKEKGGIIKAINIFVPEQHHQNCSSMEATFTGNITEIKGVNIYGSSQALQPVLAAIGQL